MNELFQYFSNWKVKNHILDNKLLIINLINNTPWSNKNNDLDIINKSNSNTILWIFWIEEDKTCPKFNCVFCANCGNYLFLHSKGIPNILCNCKKK